jgi:hypothetical protein
VHPGKLSAQENRGCNYTSLAVLGSIVASIMILACTPPFSRDALIHHLQIPKLYLQHGGIYEIPELVFSYYPMNLDLLYMGILHLGNDILAKYLHMAFGLATALLLYLYLKKRLSPTYGILGSLFFLSIPIIVKLSITVYVDLGLVFFCTASLLLLFHWIETGKRKKHLAGSAIRATIFFCLAALLTASPWLIRNSIWTGNPVYPLYNGFFNPSVTTTDTEIEPAENIKNTEVAPKKTGVRGVFARRYVLYGENIRQLLLLPIRIFFEGQDGDPRYFDGRLNPFLFLLPLISFLGIAQAGRQVRLEKNALAAFTIFYFLFAFNTGVLRIRYLVPMVPFLVILSMYGLHAMTIRVKQNITNRNLAELFSVLPVLLMFAWNSSYIYEQFQTIEPFGYLSGKLTRDEYLTERLPEYPVMQYADKHLPKTARILCLFTGWRGYYLEREHIFDHHGNQDFLLAWLQEPSMTVTDVIQRLNKNNITHLLVRSDLLRQWLLSAGVDEQKTWVLLEKEHLRPLTSHSSYTLYEIRMQTGHAEIY